MSQILTQEEIDALMRSGLSEQSFAQEPIQTPSSFQKAEFADISAIPSAPSLETAKEPSRLRRSAKVEDSVKVHPAVFSVFEEIESPTEKTSLETILQINLEIHVELGKTDKTVKEILEMGSGSVIELEKLNGEPVDLMVNKKPFAKGEMIVIGESFGVRVTDILSIPEIIEALG